MFNLTLDIHLYSSSISFIERMHVRVELTIYVGSVPVQELQSFDEKLRMALRRIVEDGIDMPRMAMIINREERQVKLSNLSIIASADGLFFE